MSLGKFCVDFAKQIILFGLVKIQLLSFRQPFYRVRKRLGTSGLMTVADNVPPPCGFFVNFLTSFPKEVLWGSVLSQYFLPLGL